MAAAGPSPRRRSLFGVMEVVFAGVGTPVRGGGEVSRLGGGRSGVAVARSGKPSDFRRWRRLLRRVGGDGSRSGAWAESVLAAAAGSGGRRPALTVATVSGGRQGRGWPGSPSRHYSLPPPSPQPPSSSPPPLIPLFSLVMSLSSLCRRHKRSRSGGFLPPFLSPSLLPVDLCCQLSSCSAARPSAPLSALVVSWRWLP